MREKKYIFDIFLILWKEISLLDKMKTKLLYSIIVVFCSIFATLTSAAKHEPQKCCRNEKNLLVNRRCVNDSAGKSPPIVLTCEEKYILNPTELEEDYYNITENATLYIADMGSYLLSSEWVNCFITQKIFIMIFAVNFRYCLVNMQDEDETYEIAIVCFPQTDLFDVPKISFEIKSLFIFISVIFLLLTLYIYYRLPELRETQVITIFLPNLLAYWKIYDGKFYL